VAILASKELRIGRLQERIDVEMREAQRLGIGEHRTVTFRNVTRPLLFAPVCCLADIPVIHLGYHAGRYGKIAIGYHRESVLKAGFSPVFYQLPDSLAAKSLLEALNCLDAVCSFEPGFMPDLDGEEKDDTAPPPDESHEEMIARINRNSLFHARKCVATVATYIKTFERHEFDSIYTEREWRSTEPFMFDYNDISMIVLPREGGYFKRFIEEAENDPIKLPRSVPIVAWEDLVEH